MKLMSTLKAFMPALAVVFPTWFLVGCYATMPQRAPSHAETCVMQERSNFDLVLNYVPEAQVDSVCRKQIRDSGGSPGSPFLMVYYACATVPCDSHLKPGERPWCLVTLPEGASADDIRYQHELAHCRGWMD